MRLLFQVTMFVAIFLIFAAAGSARSLAADGYGLTFVVPPPGGSPTVFRINVTTGQVTNVSGSSYVDVKDPQPIPPGEYRLYSTETSDNKVFWLYLAELLFASDAWERRRGGRQVAIDPTTTRVRALAKAGTRPSM